MTFEQRRPREWRDAYRFPVLTPSRAEPRGAEPRGAGRRRGSPSGCPHPASPPTASPRTQWPSGLLKGSTTRAPCHPFRAITTREYHPPDSTKSPKYVLVIRGHSRQSAVRLFDELVNETAVPRINANARGSPVAARRIVVHDPLKSPTQKHEEPKIVNVTARSPCAVAAKRATPSARRQARHDAEGDHGQPPVCVRANALAHG